MVELSSILSFLFDPSTFFIFLTALGVISYGSYRSYEFNLDLHLKDTTTVPNIAFVLFPVIGSISLLALFYFLDIMYYLLLVTISFSSLISITYTIHPFSEWLFSKQSFIADRTYKIYDDLLVSSSLIISMISSSIIVLAWFLTNDFLFVNILSICSIITAFSFIRFNNLQSLAILLWIFLVYDVFWVFISPYFFKKSVMETVATEVLDRFHLPLLITYTKFFNEGRSALGNGDMVLPGLFICQLYFLDKYYKKLPHLHSYFKISLVGYFFGLLLSFIIVITFERGQPALLTLVPFSTLPPLLVAYKRGQLTRLLKPIPKAKEDEFEESRDVLPLEVVEHVY